MAGVLVRLRLAIRRGSRENTAQRLWFVLSWLLGLGAGLAGGAFVAGADAARDGRGDLTVLTVFTVIFLAWFLGPILVPAATDQTVDPQRLEQFPISAREQVTGVLLGGLVAPTALFTFLVSAGGTVAAGESVPARLGVLVTAVVFTVLCVASARSVGALLAGALRSRRGRDFAIAISGLLGVGIFVLSQSAQDLTETFLGLADSGVQTVMAWLPPGSLAQTTLDARDGAWASAAVHLLVGVVTIGLFLWLWSTVLTRRVNGASGGRAARARPARASGLALVPAALSALQATPATAAASQQLRYFFFRSSAAVQSALFPVVLAVFIGHSTIGSASEGAAGELGLSGLVLGTAFVGVMLAGLSGSVVNVFGYDGPGFAYLMQGGAPLGQVLRGKLYASLLYLVPVVALFVLVEAAITGTWSQVFTAFTAGIAVLLLGLGTGAVLSVWAPTDRSTPGKRRRSGGGIRALVGAFGGVIAMLVLLALAAVLWWAIAAQTDPIIAALGVAATSALLSWTLIRLASTRLDANPSAMQTRLLGN